MFINFIKKHSLDSFLLLFVIIVALIIRIYNLSTIPNNVTGDEVGYLSDIYKILLTHKTYFFSFLGDGSIAGINFYWPALFVKIVGIPNALFGLRLATTITSIFCISIFYILMRLKSNSYISFLMTCLFASDYIFINFSRTGWINNMIMVFISLLLFITIDRLIKSWRLFWFILTGFLIGLGLYGYLYGKLLVMCLLFFVLLSAVLKKGLNHKRILSSILFVFIIALMTIPFVFKMHQDRGQAISTRVKATIINQKSDNNLISVLKNQGEYVIRGFILLDPSVVTRGQENSRYEPFSQPPINSLLRFIFIIAFIWALFFTCDMPILWIMIITIFFVQEVTNTPPNYARGLLFIPLIYFIIGLFCYSLWKNISKIFPAIKRNKITIFMVLCICVVAICGSNIAFYFFWMGQSEEISVRNPAVSYQDYSSFQKLQINNILHNEMPITVDRWNEIKNR